MGRSLPLPRRSGGLPLLTAAAVLCFWGAEGKVYYSCGAQFNSMERGLILSPGFPNNYSSGMHCIWQFFVPARAYLMLEIFDFDVFESLSGSQNTWDDFLPLPKNSDQEISATKKGSELPSAIFPTKESVLKHSHSKNFTSLRDGFPEPRAGESKQSYETEEPKDSANFHPTGLPFMASSNVTLPTQNGLAVNKDPKEKILFAYLTARGRDVDAEGLQKHLLEVTLAEDVTMSATPMDASSAQQPSADVCPHDVLYVSDLIAFSSRFCGTNSPLNKSMTFGSPLKMVEVIVELITTTDRGRGFAMLFDYKNDTGLTDMDESKEGRENVMMLVIIAGILFFALVLLSTLCIACRQKLCPKRSSLDVRGDQENGIQNAGVDINELRLVIPSQENENNNHSVGGNGEVTACDGSTECSPPQTDPEALSSMSAVTTESGSDEVFIISAGPGSGSLSFTSYRIQDKSLKRSIASPGSVSDWVATEAGIGPTDPGLAQTESCCPRQRTWSARAFQDLLAPLPLLQKKCCSWTTTSPFAKLVKGGGFPTLARNHPTGSGKVTSAAEIEGVSELPYSDLLASTASYPLTHSAQKQRRLSGCNLKKSRSVNPYFGFLTSSPDCNPKQLGLRSPVYSQSEGLKNSPEDSVRSSLVNGSKSKEHALTEMDKSKPVFVISEEGDDQQPLVLAEHVNQCADAPCEPSVIHNLAMSSLAEEQPTSFTVQGEGCAESTNLRTDLDLWGEHPTSYRDSLNGCSAFKEQSFVPTADTGTANAHQSFDSLVSLTLCQTSVQ